MSSLVTLAASQQAKNPRLHARIEEDRKASEALLCQFIRVADVCLEQGGNASFEWPRYCTGWSLGPLLNWIASSIPFWLDGKRPQLLPSVCCGFQLRLLGLLVNQPFNYVCMYGGARVKYGMAWHVCMHAFGSVCVYVFPCVCVSVCMHAWMGGSMEGRLYGWLAGWMDGMNACMHACLYCNFCMYVMCLMYLMYLIYLMCAMHIVYVMYSVYSTDPMYV